MQFAFDLNRCTTSTKCCSTTIPNQITLEQPCLLDYHWQTKTYLYAECRTNLWSKCISCTRTHTCPHLFTCTFKYFTFETTWTKECITTYTILTLINPFLFIHILTFFRIRTTRVKWMWPWMFKTPNALTRLCKNNISKWNYE